jgi:hypothetical protein
MPALTKLECARRQLVMSVRLFFDDSDSVSVYTLAQASWEVLDALCKHRGKTRFFEQMANVSNSDHKALRKIARYGRDFFKHADTDPEAVLDDFSDSMIDHVLIGASLDYGMLSNTKPVEVQLFPLWYFAVYPHKVPPLLAERGAVAFPDIQSLDRAQQKAAGRAALQRALLDPGTMGAPTTDPSPVISLRD